MIDNALLYYYWNCIPTDKEKAITYNELCLLWDCNARKVRHILHELSYYDNGDTMILIRSSHGKGFYKTDNTNEIERYKKECTNRARHTFAPLKKINRVLGIDHEQMCMSDYFL